jgi:hypothetical protein
LKVGYAYTDAEKEEIKFPTEHKKLYVQIRKGVSPSSKIAHSSDISRFVIFVARYAKGRSKNNADVSYRGLVKYRATMIFWARRSHSTRELPQIPGATLYNQITEAMRKAAQQYRLSLVGDVNRTQVGLAELRQLIDMDMVSTPSIEVAEGHHLAWCIIGRVCSVRPGSIAPSRLGGKTEKKLFLTWRDIVLTRGDKKGNFRVEITFRSLKTTLEDPDTALNTNKRQEFFNVTSCLLRPLKISYSRYRTVYLSSLSDVAYLRE